MIDLSRCQLVPFKHQIIGIERLIEQPTFALFDEMGAGKTFQVVVSAQVLFECGIINRVLVVAPASVRSVWFDQEFGEIRKHLWDGIPACILELHANTRVWGDLDKSHKRLFWFVTNYEFVRSHNRLPEILELCTPKTLLVLDESSAVKSYKAKQSIACLKLRKACGRVILLNGTPIANNPGDLYSQANIMDPKILGVTNWFHFRARYGVMGGWMGKQIVAWRDIDDLQKRLAPYVLRRLKVDCLDLPPKLDSVVMTVPMEEKTWQIYKQMRDEMVSWLSENTVSSAQQAIVKVIRLAQITSGFLGGVEEMDLSDFDPDSIPVEKTSILTPIQEVGREKLDFFLSWYNEQLEIDPLFKCIVFCRFRPELERLMMEIRKNLKILTGEIRGGQKRDERNIALRLLDPTTSPNSPILVGATPGAGSLGLNLTAANYMIRLSNDFSLMKRLQGDDRIHRPGQIRPVSYFDIVATGPQGQKTIDHTIVKVLKGKLDLATFTTSAWISHLQEE
jgi:SNF2 family DNA or RNA helicase